MYCMYDRWMDGWREGGRDGCMHVCMYEHVLTRMNTYEHVWTRMNTYEHVWTRVNTYEHVWTRMNTYEHVWTRMNICWKNVWIRNGVTSICVCIYIYAPYMLKVGCKIHTCWFILIQVMGWGSAGLSRTPSIALHGRLSGCLGDF